MRLHWAYFIGLAEFVAKILCCAVGVRRYVKTGVFALEMGL